MFDIIGINIGALGAKMQNRHTKWRHLLGIWVLLGRNGNPHCAKLGQILWIFFSQCYKALVRLAACQKDLILDRKWGSCDVNKGFWKKLPKKFFPHKSQSYRWILLDQLFGLRYVDLRNIYGREVCSCYNECAQKFKWKNGPFLVFFPP